MAQAQRLMTPMTSRELKQNQKQTNKQKNLQHFTGLGKGAEQEEEPNLWIFKFHLYPCGLPAFVT